MKKDLPGKNAAQAGNDEKLNKLRLLYLYRLLNEETDETHMLSTADITELMEQKYSIYMHRTTVSKDIEVLCSAGVEIMTERKKTNLYYIADRRFSIPELKILIDAVQSSKFISEAKSEQLVEKIVALTSDTNGDKLKRSVKISGRIKSENEKGYYIVDAINKAINEGTKISFFYCDYDNNKNRVLFNDGKPYTVSPYDLIWDGDYYYLVGFCDERAAMRTWRVDRIDKQPTLLSEPALERPKDYDISSYTQEAFRMYLTQAPTDVTLLCESDVMKAIIDKFGKDVDTRPVGKDKFFAKISVYAGPNFYRWIFGWGGKMIITEPEEIRREYKTLLENQLNIYSSPAKRCSWVKESNQDYVNYHDFEWGIPCHDDKKLLEFLILENFQAGLSWETILNKREAFRLAYDNYDLDRICTYDNAKVDSLMKNPYIVRNYGKIMASIENAKVFKTITEEFGSFDKYIWGFSSGKVFHVKDQSITKNELSDMVSQDLQKRGMKYVGSTIIFSYLQAIGVINGHSEDCILCDK